MNERPSTISAEIWDLTEADGKDRADWLIDAVATATQNRIFLRGEDVEDEVASEAIVANGERAIRVAMSRAIIAERERCAGKADTFLTTLAGHAGDHRSDIANLVFTSAADTSKAIAESIRRGGAE